MRVTGSASPKLPSSPRQTTLTPFFLSVEEQIQDTEREASSLGFTHPSFPVSVLQMPPCLISATSVLCPKVEPWPRYPCATELVSSSWLTVGRDGQEGWPRLEQRIVCIPGGLSPQRGRDGGTVIALRPYREHEGAALSLFHATSMKSQRA